MKAVIFDMDGLMLDTEPLYKIAWQQAARECGYEISEELYAQLIGRTRVEGEEILLRSLGSAFPLPDFRAACRRREEAVFAGSLPAKKAGLDELLLLLETHRIPKAVATSTERTQAIAQLTGLGLLTRFDVLATGDETANGKPSPDLFLLAAKRLGINPVDCLVLEDSEAGVMAAHRAGMRVFMVPDLVLPSTSIERLLDGRFESLAAVAAHLSASGQRWLQRC